MANVDSGTARRLNRIANAVDWGERLPRTNVNREEEAYSDTIRQSAAARVRFLLSAPRVVFVCTIGRPFPQVIHLPRQPTRPPRLHAVGTHVRRLASPLRDRHVCDKLSRQDSASGPRQRVPIRPATLKATSK